MKESLRAEKCGPKHATAGIGDMGSNDVKGLLRGFLARTRKLNISLFLHVPPSPGPAPSPSFPLGSCNGPI